MYTIDRPDRINYVLIRLLRRNFSTNYKRATLIYGDTNFVSNKSIRARLLAPSTKKIFFKHDWVYYYGKKQ